MKKSGVDEIVERWREGVATKKRSIISFEDTIRLKIESLKAWIWHDVEPIDTWEIRQFHYTNKCERHWVDDDWRPIKVGDTWGGQDMSALFRTSARMPARYVGKKVVFKLYFSGDSLLSINGAPYHGLDPFRDTIPLTSSSSGEEAYEFEVEGYIKWHYGEGRIKSFDSSHFAVEDTELNAAFWDLMAAYYVLITEEVVDPAVREFLKEGLTRAVAPLDQNADSFEAVKSAAMKAQSIVRREIYESTVFRNSGLLHLCGHSHLDLVYLWPYSEFLRKIGRTHSTALRLMEEFPDFIFSQSQPLLYNEMKRLYPDLFRQVKERIREGRWEAIGAFWVEPDCNLPGGESLVRQILHGRRFLMEEFGVEPKTAWIPDVFGNAWTMPQILVKSGLEYFVTHKMAVWNDTNKWDKSVFWWQGPDGSRIFATVPPSHFIGTMDPAHMKTHWDDFTEKETIGESLYTFGWGDGGGGPDTLMLECASRFKDFPGLPRTRMTTIENALESMRRKAVDAGRAIQVHNDELYLEEHRGVHTTKGRLKKLNRYCEYLYRKAEIFAVFSDLRYPKDRLDAGWEELLTNQFHDSLPGTHLTSVYADLLEVYSRVTETGEAVLRAAQEDIAATADTSGAGQALVVFNSQPFVRNSTVRLPHSAGELHVLDPDGTEIPHQFTTDLETGDSLLIFHAQSIPAVGFAVYHLVAGPGSLKLRPKTDAVNSLENAYVKVTINDRGCVTSLFDKMTGRECLERDKGGNIFQIFEDEPGQYDAWDIVSHYEDYEFELDGEVAIKVVEEGPVRAAIEIRRRILSSELVQRIVLGAESKRVDFETWVDWKETHKMLKVRFHTSVVSRHATYDIAFGNIERSTYANNSYDAARFEVPAHTWMDMSQTDYGLSLLNDCKYGHQGKESMISLTLLRSPKNPDPESDMETHTFTYSLYPHAGSFAAGGTHREALDLNDPMDVVVVDGGEETAPFRGRELSSRHSFVEIDATGVTLEALKRAEDSDDIIVRLVERHGAQSEVNLTFAARPSRARECNLMEIDEGELELDDGRLSFVIRPYEIRTFRVSM